MGISSSPLERAAQALAAADGVAHVAFFGMFAWRVVSGSGWRLVQGGFALLALVGAGASMVGWALARGGGKSRKFGMWAISVSTALAAVLLMAASWTGD